MSDTTKICQKKKGMSNSRGKLSRPLRNSIQPREKEHAPYRVELGQSLRGGLCGRNG